MLCAEVGGGRMVGKGLLLKMVMGGGETRGGLGFLFHLFFSCPAKNIECLLKNTNMYNEKDIYSVI